MDELTEKVEFFLSAQDLISKDLNSKSDPFIVVYVKRNNDNFRELGRTKVIKDSHFPQFEKQFILDYYFEEKQTLKFDIYDEDQKNSKNLKHHDLIGSCSMILGEIVHAQGQVMQKKIMKKGNTFRNKKTKMFATIKVRLEKLRQGKNAELTLRFDGKKLAKMDFLSKSDPYLEIYRTNSQMNPTLVHRTEVIQNSTNCQWEPFTITSSKLCNNDENREILIRCLDWDNDGSSDLIGEFKTSLKGLSNTNTEYELKNPTKKKKKNLGFIHCNQYKEVIRHTFLDFMSGGLQMSLMVAIDFTGSNGHPLHPKSLHYQGRGTGSQYQQAIRSVGGIVSAYDSDQKYPVWGFGAQLNGVVSHDFPLNGNPNNPEVYGIDGVEMIYRQSLNNPNMKLYGPTLFAPILAKSITIAKIAHQNNLKINNTGANLQYYVLLILTDGVINDMPETKNALVFVANTYLPLSVIIVGVGNSDFTQMHVLDADKIRLKDNQGNVAQRDVVQFVSINDCTSFSDLSSRTLKEIPKQFISYSNKFNFTPGEKIQNVNLTQQFRCNTFNEVMIQLGNKPSNLQIDSNMPDIPLPQGWEEAFDENGDKYYVNHNTQKTQWEHPYFGTTKINTNNTTTVNTNNVTTTQSTQITNQFGTTNMQQMIGTGTNNMNTNMNQNMNQMNNNFRQMNENMNQMNNQMIQNMMQMNNQMMNNMNQMNQNMNQMNQQFSDMTTNQQQQNNNNQGSQY